MSSTGGLNEGRMNAYAVISRMVLYFVVLVCPGACLNKRCRWNRVDRNHAVDFRGRILGHPGVPGHCGSQTPNRRNTADLMERAISWRMLLLLTIVSEWVSVQPHSTYNSSFQRLAALLTIHKAKTGSAFDCLAVSVQLANTTYLSNTGIHSC